MKQRTLRLVGAACLILSAAGAQATDQDYVENWEFPSTVRIVFSGTNASVVNASGAAIGYTQTNASLVITSGVAGVEYIVTGTAEDGSLKIQSPHATKLTLDGVNLTCGNGPAITLDSTNRAFVALTANTSNRLVDATTYTQSGDGALYTKGPLLLSGRGGLALIGRKKHGISAGSRFRMLGGDVAVAGAAKDGIHAQGFQMDNGTFAVAGAGGDGIDADAGPVEINGGAIRIQSAAADSKGITCNGALTVNGGVLNLTLAGTQSKGLSSAGNMAIRGGSLLLNLSGAAYLQTLTNSTTGKTYVDPAYCTGIKCDSNLTVTAGTIVITHSGLAGKCISADRDVVIQGGTFDLYTSGGCTAVFTNASAVADIAAADCLKADGNLQILGGTITAVSTGNAGDCVSSEGSAVIGVTGVTNAPVLNLTTRGTKVAVSGSGMSADYSNPKTFRAAGNLTFNGGVFKATTKNDGGEGMESKGMVTINDGNIEITAYDDCINAGTNITINGGLIYCYSSGNDGIDSNGTMTIRGGTIVSSGTTVPEEGLDCDQNRFVITGGILVGTGGATSTPTAASCTQRSVIYTATATSNMTVQVTSSLGNNLVFKVPRAYSQSMTMLFSNPGITNTVTYSIYTGGTVTGGTEFHGLCTGATVTGGTLKKTFTSTSMVTSVK